MKSFIGLLPAGLLISLTLVYSTVGVVCAQDYSMGIAKMITISGNQPVEDMSLICTDKNGFILCNEAYSPGLFGVVSLTPTAYFNEGEDEGKTPVLSDGIVDIKLSDKNGEVKKGDYVTSSETPGVAMKATSNGYVLGSAIEDSHLLQSGEKVVSIAINIHAEVGLSSTRSNLVSVIRDASKVSLLEPLAALRYLLATLLVLISFTIGFIYFGKMANTGVEAIGRNPLAEKMIRRNIILHVLIALVIIAVGLFSAYLVLIL